MNIFKLPRPIFRLAYRLALNTRRAIFGKQQCKTFGLECERESISEIYVINLERQPGRWKRVQEELSQISDAEGNSLLAMTNHFPAVDAKTLVDLPAPSVLDAKYTLADQLFVEPQPSLLPERFNLEEPIQMTRQEIAVAMSHIEVWRKIADGDSGHVLILEDDVTFSHHFAAHTDRAWGDIWKSQKCPSGFELLYLSYKEVNHGAEKTFLSTNVFQPFRGLWYLSGYVLSRRGAEKLLARLPVRGPVDLWINQQFSDLDVKATSKSLISQRTDQPSDNSYSVLPVLSKIGIRLGERPAVYEPPSLKGPVFAFGDSGSNLSSLGTALSMLGYRCCSDIEDLPDQETDRLLSDNGKPVFNAYVNVGSLTERVSALAVRYPRARFILVTVDEPRAECRSASNNRNAGPSVVQQVEEALVEAGVTPLTLSPEHNGWIPLCEFLGCVPSANDYPRILQRGQRRLERKANTNGPALRSQRLKFDESPWIASPESNWSGVPSIPEVRGHHEQSRNIEFSDSFQELDLSYWKVRDDTFPSNLALFTPSNLSLSPDLGAVLTLRQEDMGVREYSAGALSTQRQFLYGRFEAVIKSNRVPGLVTGMFLHRNSPRQEIDLEFTGNDPSKILTNVYYNPGSEGARVEYGYRGTPIAIDLGFDASCDFHKYAIEWGAEYIRWYVDERLVHQRRNWEPTPIPQLPMTFHLNHWPTNSRELAGRLRKSALPSSIAVRSVLLQTFA